MAKLCREEGCNKNVVFAKDKETGKWQVLSNSAPMWRQCGKDAQGTPLVERVYDTLVSHFVDCKNPNRFSANKKDEADSPQPDRHFSEPETRE